MWKIKSIHESAQTVECTQSAIGNPRVWKIYNFQTPVNQSFFEQWPSKSKGSLRIIYLSSTQKLIGINVSIQTVEQTQCAIGTLGYGKFSKPVNQRFFYQWPPKSIGFLKLI